MAFFDRLRRIFGGRASNGHGHPHDHGSVTCQEALAQLYDYLDGELEGVPEDQVKEHFEICGKCYPHLRFEESFRTAMKRACTGECAPEELKAHILGLLNDA